MAYKVVYFIGLVIIANIIVCSPNRSPSSCAWPYVTKCPINFKPIFDFKSVLHFNLNKEDDNLQADHIFNPISVNMERNKQSSSFGKDEKKDIIIKTEKPLIADISDKKSKKLTTIPDEHNNNNNVDFNIVFNTETSDNEILDTTNCGDDNTITTTEGQDVTTEDVFYRLSDIPPAVIATFLG